MRAAVYTRLSRRTDKNAPNLDDQLKRCREHATKRGWVVVAEHSDYGESAFERDEMDDRPGYADLLADIRSRRCDVVLAWRPDRLWRDSVESAMMMRLCVKHGVQMVATVAEGDRDPSNPGDKMVTTIVSAVGEYESASKAARSRAKHRQLAEAGQISGGGLPVYGFTDASRRMIDESEAAMIREAATRLLAGEGLRGVAADLGRRGIRTKLGRPWTAGNLRRLLRAPHIAGLRRHQGQVVGQASWPAIVDPETWAAVQDILDHPKRQLPPGRREYLLSRGIAVCGLCGAALVARPRSDKRRAYACVAGLGYHGCGKIGRLAEPLEADVEARLWAAIDAGDIGDVPAPEPDVTAADVNAAEVKLTSLARDYYVHGVIAREQYLDIREPLAAEAARLRALLAETPKEAPMSLVELRSAWGSMTIAERREALRPLLTVVLHPCVRGRKAYDESTVEVRWLR